MTEAATEAVVGAGATEVTTEVVVEASAPPEWMGTLPDELKGDATLQRYADVPALAKAHIEAHKVAKSKVIVPGADADDVALAAFYDAIGRPESPDKYEIPMVELPVDAPEEARAARDAAYQPFRALAHEIGLTPKQATRLGQFELDRQQSYFANGQAEIDALKKELGPDYDPKLAAGQKILAQLLGADAEAFQTANEMEKKVGSARLVKLTMRLGEIAGEHGLVESDTVEGFGEVADAEAKLTEMQKDKTWREKLNSGDPIVKAQRDRLMELAKKQAVRRSGATTAE